MTYYIGQAAGILVTIGAILSMQMKKKWQILLLNATVSLLAALNILLLDQFSTGVVVNCIAVIQVAFSLWHDQKGDEPALWEKIFFAVAYIGCSILSFASLLDILAIFAIVFYMLGVFQKDEQRIRLFLLGNSSCWLIYHGILGSTAAFGQLAAITSALLGLYRYRKK